MSVLRNGQTKNFVFSKEGNGEGPAELEEYNTEEEDNCWAHERINRSVKEDDEEEIGEYMEEHQDADESKAAHSQVEEEENEEDSRWVLIADKQEQEEQQGPTGGATMSKGPGFIAALIRNVEILDHELQAMGVATRRGTRDRRPRTFFDEDGKVDASVRTTEKEQQPRQAVPADKQGDVGVNRRKCKNVGNEG